MNVLCCIILGLQMWNSQSFSIKRQSNEMWSRFNERNPKKVGPARQHKIVSLSRSKFLHDILSNCQTILGMVMIRPDMALANNLPPSNGADLSQTGTISTLIPIIRMQMSLQQVQNLILEQEDPNENKTISLNKLHQIDRICKQIPQEEKLFKKVFDEYSDPVSYKQKYMDQNAFLVYYTKGFDGIGRESIEKGDIPRQTLQYGARNEVWNAFDDFMAEVQYSLGNVENDGGSTTTTTKISRDDLLIPLNQALSALDAYLKLVPINDLAMAKERM